MAFKPASLVSAIPILRLIIILLVTITIICLAVAFPMTDEPYDFEFYADGTGPAILGIGFLPATWALLWESIAVGLTLFNIYFHPGVDIGLEIIGWGSSFSVGVVLIWWQAYGNYTNLYCPGAAYPDAWQCYMWRRMNGLSYSSGAMLLVAACLQFAIFVVACKKTDDERRSYAARKHSRISAA